MCDRSKYGKKWKGFTGRACVQRGLSGRILHPVAICGPDPFLSFASPVYRVEGFLRRNRGLLSSLDLFLLI